MVDFRGLETFYWVVTLGSFGKAARKLNTTQPAVSHRIASLESALSGRLLIRNTRQVVATARGRELLVYAEKLLSLRAELIDRIGDPSAVHGVLRIGVSETLVHTWLSSLVRELNQAYPELTVEIDVDVSSVLRARLLAQEIELALLLGPLSASTVSNVDLCSYRLAFLASPTLDIAHPATLHDLARYSIFTFSRQTAPYEILRGLMRAPGLPPVSLNASTSLATVVRLAVDGLGVAVIPPVIVQPELDAGALVENSKRCHLTGVVVLSELACDARCLADRNRCRPGGDDGRGLGGSLKGTRWCFPSPLCWIQWIANRETGEVHVSVRSKIRSVETVACDAGWRNYHFVKILAEDGNVGWSEFSEGFGAPGVGAAIDRLSGHLVGQPVGDHERLFTELYAFTRPAAGGVVALALGALENALLDAKAKALGVPCYELLGGKVRDRIRVYWSHCATWRINHAQYADKPIRSLDDARAMGAEVRESGFGAFKTNMFIYDENGENPKGWRPGLRVTKLP